MSPGLHQGSRYDNLNEVESRSWIIGVSLFWLAVGAGVAWKMGWLGGVKPFYTTENKETNPCGKDEEYVVFQTGKKGCYKKPQDAGKSCTKSTECESGDCVTTQIKAAKGVCFGSMVHEPCIFGYWTIEEAQTKNPPKQLPGGGIAVENPFCVY